MSSKQTLIDIMSYYLPIDVIETVIGYIELNDKAHDLDHILATVNTAKMLIDTYRVTYDDELERMGMIATFMHDIGSHVDRKMHHKVGALMAGDVLMPLVDRPGYSFSKSQVFCIMNAIAQHRASFKGVRVDPVSDLVAAADRGRLNNHSAMMVRCIEAQNGSRREVIEWHTFELAWSHAIIKYGPGGYAWLTLPDLTSNTFLEEVTDLMDWFDPAKRPDRIGYYMENGLTAYNGDKWKYQRASGNFHYQGADKKE